MNDDLEFVPAEGEPEPGGIGPAAMMAGDEHQSADAIRRMGEAALGGPVATSQNISDRVRAQEDAVRMTVAETATGKPREIMDAAQDSSLVGDSMFSLGARPYLLEPHWPRNGREAGAWVAGVMDALSDPSGSIHVRLKPEHEEGAAGALLSAGFKVERYASDLYGMVPLDVPDGWTGQSVTLAVART